jgi:hypothetical protein
MNPHKLYISSIAVICLLILIVGSAWRDHVRDDARRDAILGMQKSDIATLQQNIAAARNTMQARIAELERKKDSVMANPSRAAEMIRELVPMQSPIRQTAALNSQSPPDAPSATLTKQQEVDLAQYALTCKQCSVQRDELEQQSKDQEQIISRQKLEIEAEKKSAKGGSVWQRTARIAKWGAIFGGIGYVMGRAQR